MFNWTATDKWTNVCVCVCVLSLLAVQWCVCGENTTNSGELASFAVSYHVVFFHSLSFESTSRPYKGRWAAIHISWMKCPIIERRCMSIDDHCPLHIQDMANIHLTLNKTSTKERHAIPVMPKVHHRTNHWTIHQFIGVQDLNDGTWVCKERKREKKKIKAKSTEKGYAKMVQTQVSEQINWIESMGSLW